jgi:hypothetical protein
MVLQAVGSQDSRSCTYNSLSAPGCPPGVPGEAHTWPLQLQTQGRESA